MNERIQQLKESTRPEIDWEARHYVELNNGEKEKWMDEWFEKFAELIVQECCAIADQVERADMDSYVSKYIKAHFGVEE
jgi:hypothetical protein